MDAFYASVEQRDAPLLKGKPVAVGYPGKRGVVAAASYEARRFGVHSAMPSIVAMRLCPDLIFMPIRFDVYRMVSNQIHAIFAQYTDLIEPLALDEAYLDVTENKKGIPTAWKTAKAIREDILDTTHLTASAGVSYNKFLAKIASGMRKPNGQFAIMPEDGEAFINMLPVTKFHGIGPVIAKKMHELGIHTGADLRARSLEELNNRFGKHGAWYYNISRGLDDRLVNSHREQKSISSETTFAENLIDQAEIETGVTSLADNLWSWVERTGKYGRTVTVKIKWEDFQQSTRSRSVKQPINDIKQFRQVSIELIRTVLPLPKGIRLIGVTLSNFPIAPSSETLQIK